MVGRKEGDVVSQSSTVRYGTVLAERQRLSLCAHISRFMLGRGIRGSVCLSVCLSSSCL